MIRIVVPCKDGKIIYDREFIVNEVKEELYELIEDVPCKGEELLDRGTESEMFLKLIEEIGGNWEEEL